MNPKDRKVVVCENFVQRDLFRFTLADVLFKQFSVSNPTETDCMSNPTETDCVNNPTETDC